MHYHPELGRDAARRAASSPFGSRLRALEAPPDSPANGVLRQPAVHALGYASVANGSSPDGPEFGRQAREIEALCEGRGFALQELVRDIEPHHGGDLGRPGLMYALERIAARESSCLVVAALERLARSAADIGTLVEWFQQSEARLVAIDVGLDTGTESGRVAARALVGVGQVDRRKVAERTRKGLAAARAKGRSTGRPAVSDRPELRERISAMRERGLTLQAIADALNADGVPTLRGGSEWRPSSVQVAAGYKRPGSRRSLSDLPSIEPAAREAGE